MMGQRLAGLWGVTSAATGAIVVLGLTLVGAAPARAGAIVATTRLGKGIVNPHPIAVDGRLGRVFVVNASHFARSVSILDAVTGHLMKAVPVGGFPIVVALDGRSQRMFVGMWGDQGVMNAGRVAVIDAAAGRVVRTVRVGPNPQAIAIDELTNRAFVLNSGDLPTRTHGGVTILDATDGQVLRTVAAGSSPQAAVVDTRRGRVFIANAGAGETAAGTISVRDATSGRLLRTLPGGGYPWALALDARTGHLFAGGLGSNGDTSVRMLDAGTGAPLRAADLGPRSVVGGLVVDDGAGRVILTSYDSERMTGRYRVLDAASGRVLRNSAMGPLPTLVAVDGQAGRVIVGHSWYNNGTVSGGANVSILDEGSGRVLRSIDADPWALTVDPPADRAFVTDADNNVSILDVASGALRPV